MAARADHFWLCVVGVVDRDVAEKDPILFRETCLVFATICSCLWCLVMFELRGGEEVR